MAVGGGAWNSAGHTVVVPMHRVKPWSMLGTAQWGARCVARGQHCFNYKRVYCLKT